MDCACVIKGWKEWLMSGQLKSSYTLKLYILMQSYCCLPSYSEIQTDCFLKKLFLKNYWKNYFLNLFFQKTIFICKWIKFPTVLIDISRNRRAFLHSLWREKMYWQFELFFENDTKANVNKYNNKWHLKVDYARSTTSSSERIKKH